MSVTTICGMPQGVRMGRTSGVESHRTLGDQWSPHPPIRRRRTAMTANPEPIVPLVPHAFQHLRTAGTGPDARSPTA
jgi:hypothetical protein